MTEHVHRWQLQPQKPEADGVCSCGAVKHFDGYRLNAELNREFRPIDRVSLPIAPRDTSWVHP